MNDRKSEIFGDMSAIRLKGVEKFQSEYYWPISEEKYHRFVSSLHEDYSEIVSNIKDDCVFDMATVELSFVRQLQNICQYNFLKNYTDKNSYDLLVGKDSEKLFSPNWGEIKNFYKYKHTLKKGVFSFFRNTVKNIIFNINPYKYLTPNKIYSKKTPISIGSNDRLKKEFVDKNSLFVNHKNWFNLIDKNKTENKYKKELICNEVKKIVIEPFLRKMKKQDLYFIEGLDFKLIENVWIERFRDIECLYNKIFSVDKVDLLLVTEVANPFHKLLTVAYQRQGTSVYCFHHGNDSAIIRHEIGHSITTSHCNKFVVPTDGIADIYRDNYNNLAIEKRYKTEYLSIDSTWYQDIIDESKRSSQPPYLKKIMLIGFPHNSLRYTNESASFFYPKLDLEIKICKLLKRHGYDVIYKTHPDRFTEVSGIFDGIVKEVVKDRFEEVWSIADALLFTHTSTTTFGYAVNLNRKIILFDYGEYIKGNDALKDAFYKRVCSIPAKVDYNARVIFNEQDVLSCLSPNYNPIDFSYPEKVFGKS
jgi:hypothetical protein